MVLVPGMDTGVIVRSSLGYLFACALLLIVDYLNATWQEPILHNGSNCVNQRCYQAKSLTLYDVTKPQVISTIDEVVKAQNEKDTGYSLACLTDHCVLRIHAGSAPKRSKLIDNIDEALRRNTSVAKTR